MIEDIRPVFLNILINIDNPDYGTLIIDSEFLIELEKMGFLEERKNSRPKLSQKGKDAIYSITHKTI